MIVRSGQVHRSLVGHTGPVTCLQFDDIHLVTGSLDRSIRVRDLIPIFPLRRFLTYPRYGIYELARYLTFLATTTL